VLRLLLDLDGVARLQRPQRLERPRDEGLPALQARRHLQRELAQEARLDGLEAGLAALHQEYARLVARRVRGRLARLLLTVADHEGLDRDHQGLWAEA